MTPNLRTPQELEPEIFEEIFELVASGGEVNKQTLRAGLLRAELIAYFVDNGKIVSIAAIKQPLDSYKNRIFTEANVPSKAKDYSLELGYIITKDGFTRHKLCQKLLAALLPRFDKHTFFATTRNPIMKHILGKMGFELCGKIYKEDLQILTRSSVKQ